MRELEAEPGYPKSHSKAAQDRPGVKPPIPIMALKLGSRPSGCYLIFEHVQACE